MAASLEKQKQEEASRNLQRYFADLMRDADDISKTVESSVKQDSTPMAVGVAESYDHLSDDQREELYQSRSRATKTLRQKFNVEVNSMESRINAHDLERGGVPPPLNELQGRAQREIDLLNEILRIRVWVEAPLTEQQRMTRSRYHNELHGRHKDFQRCLMHVMPQNRIPIPTTNYDLPDYYKETLFPEFLPIEIPRIHVQTTVPSTTAAATVYPDLSLNPETKSPTTTDTSSESAATGDGNQLFDPNLLEQQYNPTQSPSPTRTPSNPTPTRPPPATMPSRTTAPPNVTSTGPPPGPPFGTPTGPPRGQRPFTPAASTPQAQTAFRPIPTAPTVPMPGTGNPSIFTQATGQTVTPGYPPGYIPGAPNPYYNVGPPLLTGQTPPTNVSRPPGPPAGVPLQSGPGHQGVPPSTSGQQNPTGISGQPQGFPGNQPSNMPPSGMPQGPQAGTPQFDPILLQFLQNQQHVIQQLSGQVQNLANQQAQNQAGSGQGAPLPPPSHPSGHPGGSGGGHQGPPAGSGAGQGGNPGGSGNQPPPGPGFGAFQMQQDQFLAAQNRTTDIFAQIMDAFSASQERIMQLQVDSKKESSKDMRRAMLAKPTEANKEIGTFNGDLTKWPTFKALFEAKMADYEAVGYGDNEKFLALKSCMRGEALAKIESLPPVDHTFEPAKKRLYEWYNNERMLIQGLFQTFRELANTRCKNYDKQGHTQLYNDLVGLYDLQKSLFPDPADALKALFVTLAEHAMSQDAFNKWELVRNSMKNEAKPSGTDAGWEEIVVSLRDTVETYAASEMQKLPAKKTSEDKSEGKKKDKKKKQDSEEMSSTGGMALAGKAAGSDDKKPKRVYEPPKGMCPICNKVELAVHKFWSRCSLVKGMTKEQVLLKLLQAVTKRCQNCLGEGHTASKCTHNPCGLPLGDSGNTCQKRHARPLHGIKDFKAKLAELEQNDKAKAVRRSTAEHGHVICRSVICYAVGPTGTKLRVRILYDTGSELSIIRKSVADALGLTGPTKSIKMEVVGDTKTFDKQIITKVQLESLDGKFAVSDVEVSTLPYITTSPMFIPTDPKKYDHLKNLTFTEELPMKNSDSGIVDILIGEPDVSYLMDEPIKGKNRYEPSAVSTKLGYCLSGSDRNAKMSRVNVAKFTVLRAVQPPVQEFPLNKFWELEHMAIRSDLSELTKGEILAVEHMEKNSYRTPTGSHHGFWTTGLPFDKRKPELTDVNMRKAIGVARAFARKAKSEEQKKATEVAYEAFLENDFAEEVPAKDIPSPKARYCESFAVLEPTRNTKVRIVINPSGLDKDGLSLNGSLLQGPLLLPNLVSLLLRFRARPIVIGSDCSKMYLRVHIHPGERDLLRFVFFRGEELVHARFKALAFGLTPAPFMAVWAAQESARMTQDRWKLGAASILNDLYVDDCLTTASTVSEAKQKASEIKKVLEFGGFSSHKWISSHPGVLKDVPPDLHSKENIVSVLGIKWNLEKDAVMIMPKFEHTPMEKITKRNLLSTIARIFDILGLLSPVWTMPKVWIQDMWQNKLDWDDEIQDPEMLKQIQDWDSQLDQLSTFEINRCQVPSGFIPKRVVAFADSSKLAYATAIYIVSENKDKDLSSSLCFAKARVKPLTMPDEGEITIVRLELLAAVIAARASAFVKKSLDLNESYLFSDSQINLSRLLKDFHDYKIWTASRLEDILSLTKPEDWFYIPTALNPADLNSRGMTLDELKDCDLWWQGPPQLVQPGPWQKVSSETKINSDIDNAEKPKKPPKVMLVAMSKPTGKKKPEPWYKSILDWHHSWRSTVIVACLVLRAAARFSRGRVSWPFAARTPTQTASRPRTRRGKRNAKQKIKDDFEEVDVDEFYAGEIWLFKQAQAEEFAKELLDLKETNKVHKSSSIRDMIPKLLANGLIVGTPRTKEFSSNDLAKEPPILPKWSRVTDKFVQHVHLQHKHAETEQTLANLKSRVWICGGRREIRRILHKCLCRPPTPLTQRMAPLPKHRGEHTIFKTISCDLFGPFAVRFSMDTSVSPMKMWGCIFVCDVTRAIHLELVEDAGTPAFMKAFRRYCSRRGTPSSVHSDNGLGFVKASKELRKFYDSINWKQISKDTVKDGIKWTFTRPHTPHENAAAERQIKNVKNCLRKTLGKALLNYIDFTTLLQEVEAIVNNRPLGVVYESKDYHVITPFHFANGRPLDMLPDDPNRLDKTSKVSQMWLYRKRLLNNFWKRFHRQYLSNLSATTLWQDNLNKKLKPGMLVQIRDDNLARNTWKTGRIQQLIYGKDKKIRAAAILLSNKSIVERSIHRLSLFELV